MTELERLTEIVRESSRVNRSNGAVRMEVPHNVCEQIAGDVLIALKDAPDDVIKVMLYGYWRVGEIDEASMPALIFHMRNALASGIDKILGEMK